MVHVCDCVYSRQQLNAWSVGIHRKMEDWMWTGVHAVRVSLAIVQTNSLKEMFLKWLNECVSATGTPPRLSLSFGHRCWLTVFAICKTQKFLCLLYAVRFVCKLNGEKTIYRRIKCALCWRRRCYHCYLFYKAKSYFSLSSLISLRDCMNQLRVHNSDGSWLSCSLKSFASN